MPFKHPRRDIAHLFDTLQYLDRCQNYDEKGASGHCRSLNLSMNERQARDEVAEFRSVLSRMKSPPPAYVISANEQTSPIHSSRLILLVPVLVRPVHLFQPRLFIEIRAKPQRETISLQHTRETPPHETLLPFGTLQACVPSTHLFIRPADACAVA